VGFTKEKYRTITMSQEQWESWHQKHTANSKKLSSGSPGLSDGSGTSEVWSDGEHAGQNWRVPFQKIVGHTYLPIGSMENSLKNFRNSANFDRMTGQPTITWRNIPETTTPLDSSFSHYANRTNNKHL